MRGLSGRGVLVSGGTSGIGLAAARRFLEEGCRVYVCGHDADELAAALHELEQAAGSVCDVSDPDAVASMVAAAEAFTGGVDVLANNAGIAWQEAFLDTTVEHWDRVLAVNLRWRRIASTVDP